MLRTALRPRWLALLALVLLAATGMSLLGRWQLDRAREHGRQRSERAAAAPARPVEQVLPPRTTFPKDGVGAPVTAQGTWDDDRRLLVAGRELGGRKGYWVLVPLVLADGSAVPVVRGWVPTPTDPAASSASGRAGVSGVLEPTEPPEQLAPGQASGLPADQLNVVSMPDLVRHWPQRALTTGFVLASSETPAVAPVPRRVPPPDGGGGLDLQNLAYAVQWWLFAAVGLFFWWRLVRDDHLGRLRPREPVREDGPTVDNAGVT